MPKPPPRVLLERCVEHCSRPGWRLAYSVLRDREAAFDAVQQAFVVAATKPERIPRDDPWPWFSTVLMHECRNYRRKKRPVPVGCAPVETRSPDEGPDEKALVSETRERLWGAIDELSETEREAVVLTHVAGLTHERAAQLLGLSRQAVTSALGRAFDRLRHLLGDTG
ncbi:MAG: sigma-70 family RNA polymerase sigma factor, partial [Planctomycetes bacterium]|nr:sigma-70 family RNA polymerase sigma factor [Planctomycetota bacterium]